VKLQETIAYQTKLGKAYQSSVEDFLDAKVCGELSGQVSLVFTSPPFPLVKKKKYGNKSEDDYVEWFAGLAPKLQGLLTDDGSIVIEIGNAWIKGEPEMSTAPLKALIAFKEAAGLSLCQQFVCHNPARLPSPIEWVNKQRIRVKDSYTHVWWMSPNSRPKANNANVLRPYSKAMEKLLDRGTYNSGERPSEHNIGEHSFNNRNEGAIPPSALDGLSDFDDLFAAMHEILQTGFGESFLEYSNTSSSSSYRDYCKAMGIGPHPALMNEKLAKFFIEFLTDENDLVLDPFAGSNTTGAVAEHLKRRWVAIERDATDNGTPLGYLEGSKGRFPDLDAASPPA